MIDTIISLASLFAFISITLAFILIVRKQQKKEIDELYRSTQESQEFVD